MVIFRRSLVLSILLTFLILNSLSASEITNGYVRLILHERTGRFSLYYLSEPDAMRYEPLFNGREPAASYLSVSVNGNIYRLGDSKNFQTRLERQNGNPAFVFESSFLTVSEVFSPVRTANSHFANGVMITVTIQNTADRPASVGLRILIDTELGEGRGRIPFLTNSQIITNEMLIEGTSGELFWVSRGQRTALMGSIVNPVDFNSRVPDFVHIANWKRLNDVSWRLRYSEGRSFNSLPYSIRDSAVCYYYEPAALENDEIFTFSIVLTTEDMEWYNSIVPPQVVVEPAAVESPATERGAPTIDITAIEQEAIANAAENNEDAGTLTLVKLQEILDQFISGEIELNEHDLLEIEGSINRLRNRN
jgi:hypothetical protein